MRQKLGSPGIPGRHASDGLSFPATTVAASSAVSAGTLKKAAISAGKARCDRSLLNDRHCVRGMLSLHNRNGQLVFGSPINPSQIPARRQLRCPTDSLPCHCF